MLNEMRYGKLTPASIAKFKKLSRPLKFDDGIDATELCVSTKAMFYKITDAA
jgi:ATP-dependent DNA helicase PIF1